MKLLGGNKAVLMGDVLPLEPLLPTHIATRPACDISDIQRLAVEGVLADRLRRKGMTPECVVGTIVFHGHLCVVVGARTL